MNFKQGANVVYKKRRKIRVGKGSTGADPGGWMGWLATPLCRWKKKIKKVGFPQTLS